MAYFLNFTRVLFWGICSKAQLKLEELQTLSCFDVSVVLITTFTNIIFKFFLKYALRYQNAERRTFSRIFVNIKKYLKNNLSVCSFLFLKCISALKFLTKSTTVSTNGFDGELNLSIPQQIMVTKAQYLPCYLVGGYSYESIEIKDDCLNKILLLVKVLMCPLVFNIFVYCICSE